MAFDTFFFLHIAVLTHSLLLITNTLFPGMPDSGTVIYTEDLFAGLNTFLYSLSRNYFSSRSATINNTEDCHHRITHPSTDPLSIGGSL